MAVATGVVALATLVYAVVAYFQWQALLSSNRINREAVEVVQRAFFTETVETSMQTENATKSIAFQAHWQNSGSTPAVELIQYFNAAPLNAEPSGDEFRGVKTSHKFSATAVPPKGDARSRFVPIPESYFTEKEQIGVPLKQQHVNMIKGRFFAWGWIAYRDSFPDTEPHVVEFCGELQGAAYLSSNPNMTMFDWRACDEHNCVDQYCEDYKSLADLVPK